MDDFETFDPALFGLWPRAAAYDALPASGRGGWSEDERREAIEEFFLETKSADASPQEDLRVLLNDMTREMRGQFDYFRSLRAAAASLADDGDEAAAKLARADAKAATDAMSLIVRTLEKVDALQRQLARDRELEAERNADNEGYEEARHKLADFIEQRARERVCEILAQRERAASAGAPATDVAAGATGPPAGQVAGGD